MILMFLTLFVTIAVPVCIGLFVYQDAKSHILKAIKVFESYPDLSDAAGFRSDHSQCYRLLGGICLRHGESSEAFNYMMTAQAIEKGK